MAVRGDQLLLIAFVVGVLLHLVPAQERRDSTSAPPTERPAAEMAPPSSLADPSGSQLSTSAEETPSTRVEAPEKETEPETVRTLQLSDPIGLEEYSFEDVDAIRHELPKKLREISGLAMTADQRLLAHNDEKGAVFELDLETGDIVKSFELADWKKRVSDDFEGIAVAENMIYMVTSVGRLYEFREGTDGEKVLYNTYGTGVGRECEIEGLTYHPAARQLLLMSKNPRSAALGGMLAIYRWSIDTKELVDGGHTVFPIADVSSLLGDETFQPSGIEWHPLSGHYFLVAAQQAAVAEVRPTGEVVAVRRLPVGWHRQAEGITFAPNYSLIVSDEAGGKGRQGRLAFYPLGN